MVKNEVGAGVRFVKFAGEDGAVVTAIDDGGVAEVALDDALAKGAAVDDGPRFVELFSVVAGLRGAAFDLEFF